MRVPANGCSRCNSSIRRISARSAGETSRGVEYALERASPSTVH